MYTSTFYHILKLYIFLKDFVDKIAATRSKFQNSKMNSFERATEDEIKKLILSSSSKSCDLDPIPTSVLKNRLDILVTPITDIINISMDTSTFPKKKQRSSCKTTTSLPKRAETELLKNNHLSNPLQSAYRKHHSSESALLKVHNDIIISMDKGEVTALTLLDLSVAFDTIDDATLPNRLSNWYGLSTSGQGQIWFSS